MHELYFEFLNCYELNLSPTFHYFSWNWHQIIFGLKLLIFQCWQYISTFSIFCSCPCIPKFITNLYRYFFTQLFLNSVKNCLTHWYTDVGHLKMLPVLGLLCTSQHCHASTLRWLLFTPGITSQGLQMSSPPSWQLCILGSTLAWSRQL